MYTDKVPLIPSVWKYELIEAFLSHTQLFLLNIFCQGTSILSCSCVMSYYIVQYDLIETKQNKTFSHEILSSFWNQKMIKASLQHWTLNTPWCLLACVQGFLRHNNQMTVRRAGWERAAGSLSVTCDLCIGAAFLCRCSQWVIARVRLQHCYSDPGPASLTQLPMWLQVTEDLSTYQAPLSPSTSYPCSASWVPWDCAPWQVGALPATST